ncbi:MAG: hypothetical protein JWQ11_1525 [Rhizobacter sp.]|nr:hypothetical protein [Rhizobacter sp.]
MSEPSNGDTLQVHSAFYRFVRIADVGAVVDVVRELSADVFGSVLLASEGVNGMIAAAPDAVDAFERALTGDVRLQGLFAGMPFKHSDCMTPPFQRMKVHHRPEVLPIGVDGVDAVAHHGIDVSPHDWRALIEQPDVVLVDNRNSFEFRLGRFNGAVDPGVNHYRDFADFVRAHVDEWQREGKRVAMYCTGGIRCEKTSAWMAELAPNLPVLQLEGGILNYFAQVPDAERDWQGECFVFDNRVALDTRLRQTGTTPEAVYADPADGWRLRRAKRLAESAGGPSSDTSRHVRTNVLHAGGPMAAASPGERPRDDTTP